MSRMTGMQRSSSTGSSAISPPANILIDNDVIATHLNTGEIISHHLIEPEKSYWRDQT